ncbi:MAG: hypothetical protein ACAH18_06650 [Methylophilaceae bacterium]
MRYAYWRPTTQGDIQAKSPAAAPSSTAKTGAFGNQLFEFRDRPRFCGLLGRVLIAARLGEQRRGVRSTAAAGSPSLWFLSLGETRERNLPPGNLGK